MKVPDTAAALSQRRVNALACLTVLASAFLLFVLELVTAKALLPRFGGSPMVWTTSMLVYQILLLAGYAYAHALAGRRSGRVQAAVHIGVLMAAVAVAGWRLHAGTLVGGDPASISQHPFADLLLTLLGTLALPFVAVSATSPLVQHWQQRLEPGRSVYWLYAVSNVGSFAGLLAYPFVIEPLLSVERQFALWTALFALVSLGLSVMALRARHAQPVRKEARGAEKGPGAAAHTGCGWRAILAWLALSAGTSALLLAATNELCQDLAVFPFLWVLPLSLYLLTFTLAFRSRRTRNRLPEAAVVTVAALSTSAASLMLPAPVHIVSIGVLVFVLCLAAHRELYRVRPPEERLTAYYLWVAAGSGIGATGVALLAPVLFLGYWEFQLAILALWIALVAVVAADREGSLRAGDPRQCAALLGLVIYMVINQIPEQWLRQQVAVWPAVWSVIIRVGLAVGLAALLWTLVLRRRTVSRSVVWPRALAVLVIFMAECGVVHRVRGDLRQSGRVARNFFGVIHVQDVLNSASGARVRQLMHGRINHGWQYVDPDLHRLPTSYHSPSTGIGRVIRVLQARKESIHVGVTGLGAGALAAYPRAEDRIVFYEIDPQVVELSVGKRASFSFVNDCPGQAEVVLGDARQSLDAELTRKGGRGYDVLALDAFSGDAVPMHLLTHEAFALYLRHLAQPGGVLAVNISNLFLDLEPVLADTAQALGLHALLIDSLGDPPVRARSLWVLLSRDGSALQDPHLTSAARPLAEGRVAWTDTYCSPFRLLKWWSPNSRLLRVLPKRTPQESATAPE